MNSNNLTIEQVISVVDPLLKANPAFISQLKKMFHNKQNTGGEISVSEDKKSVILRSYYKDKGRPDDNQIASESKISLDNYGISIDSATACYIATSKIDFDEIDDVYFSFSSTWINEKGIEINYSSFFCPGMLKGYRSDIRSFEAMLIQANERKPKFSGNMLPLSLSSYVKKENVSSFLVCRTEENPGMLYIIENEKNNIKNYYTELHGQYPNILMGSGIKYTEEQFNDQSQYFNRPDFYLNMVNNCAYAHGEYPGEKEIFLNLLTDAEEYGIRKSGISV